MQPEKGMVIGPFYAMPRAVEEQLYRASLALASL